MRMLTCKQAEKMVMPYIDGRLDEEELEDYDVPKTIEVEQEYTVTVPEKDMAGENWKFTLLCM